MRPLLVIAVLLPAVGSLAEDLRSNDGTIYHNIKEVKADPDGLVFVYDKGMAKVDFERLSRDLQRRFGYDQRKAAAYRTHELAVVQGNQQILKEHEEQELERIRRAMEAGGSGNELIYSGGEGPGTAARRARLIQQEMEAKEEAAVIESRRPRTFWDAPFWQSPVVKVIGAIFGGGGAHGGQGVINNGAGFDNHRGFSN